MRKSDRQQLSIKCECYIFKNGFSQLGKRKSKFSTLTLNSQTRILSVIPFDGKTETMKFEVDRLHTIHKKYLQEGKITIDFLEKRDRITLKGVDVVSVDELQDIITQIIVNDASKENLQLLINKLIALRKVVKQPDSKRESSATVSNERPLKRKSKVHDDDDKCPALTRKQLRRIVERGQQRQIRTKLTDIPMIVEAPPKKIDLSSLPCNILNQILAFCNFSLYYRVLNKRMSELILQNIQSIKLKDEVDEQTFNKLCRWAVNIECKMKRVKTIDLFNQKQQTQLIRGVAKTLKFGFWKNMSVKNAKQLMTLKIFCLQIPYWIKFDLSNLFGLRMVQLRLKSPKVTTVNYFIKDEHVAFICNSIKNDLRVLELPYCSASFFGMLKFPQNFQELLLQTVELDTKAPERWWDLSKFSNLKSLSICYLERSQTRKQILEQLDFKMILPLRIVSLQIGSFIIPNVFEGLCELQILKLVGDAYKNFIMHNIHFPPNLKVFDITGSHCVRMDSFAYLPNVTVKTDWSREVIDQANQYYGVQNTLFVTNI